ncbi:MAG: SpoIIE family protein phosphatase, partial [Acaryochloridaceae cyanobacterium RL_2_7]|nr:SpoIIE family protein phosphatase [Acaryochloridaceae cyanobacterium RL_2_7]
DTLLDRFVFRGPQVVLDVRPGLLPESEYDIPSLFIPYLKLFPHRIHYSQFFSILWVGEGKERAPILLLDQAPLSPNDLSQTILTDKEPGQHAAPLASASSLAQAWPQARPIRQLNWLWQIAHLWDDFISHGVGQSLISPALLRVEGPLIRILELHNDLPAAPPTLSNLGAMLSKFKSLTPGSLNFLFSELCDDLISEKIKNTQELIKSLEEAIFTCQNSHSLNINLATLTDPGVVRKHNEDQCFPPSGSYFQSSPNSTDSLLIVCDGVGGHAGGEVASATAIEALKEHLGNLILDTLSPNKIKQELIKASCHANDLISQRNDEEQRQERARMGTTLVMALVHNQQLYITHIGDSRAYLITKVGCYQLTVDDDIASREVRLGYLPYHEALRQPTSGSLVQALGMASSQTLHPTVQRFILDDECILLLCSDGLSDYDRVEELWQEELLPLLYRNYDLASVSERLISLANHLNGHDNITVGIMSISRGQRAGETAATVKTRKC